MEVRCTYANSAGTFTNVLLDSAAATPNGQQTINVSFAPVQEQVCDLLRDVAIGGGTSASASGHGRPQGRERSTTHTGLDGVASVGAPGDGLDYCLGREPHGAAADRARCSPGPERSTTFAIDGAAATADPAAIQKSGLTTTVTQNLKTNGSALVQLVRTYVSESGGRGVVVTDRFTIAQRRAARARRSPTSLRALRSTPASRLAHAGRGVRRPSPAAARSPAPRPCRRRSACSAARASTPTPAAPSSSAGKPGTFTFASARKFDRAGDARHAGDGQPRVRHRRARQADADALAAALAVRLQPEVALNAPASTESASALGHRHRDARAATAGRRRSTSTASARRSTRPPAPTRRSSRSMPAANTVTATVTDPGGAVVSASRTVTRTVPPAPPDPDPDPDADAPAPPADPDADRRRSLLSPASRSARSPSTARPCASAMRCATGGSCAGEARRRPPPRSVKKRNGKTVTSPTRVGQGLVRPSRAGEARGLKLELSKKAAARATRPRSPCRSRSSRTVDDPAGAEGQNVHQDVHGQAAEEEPEEDVKRCSRTRRHPGPAP